jgi:hypothetical protein
VKVKLLQPVLDGTTWHPDGRELDVEPERALHLVQTGAGELTEPNERAALATLKAIRAASDVAAHQLLAGLHASASATPQTRK